MDKHLLQLDFGGLEDSSDDSDYEVADYQDGEYCLIILIVYLSVS